MIVAKFFKSSRKFIGFQISGHAGFAESGYDIVCASVSSAVQLTANNITEIFQIEADVSVEENLISLRVNEENDIADKLIYGLNFHFNLVSEEFSDELTVEEYNAD